MSILEKDLHFGFLRSRSTMNACCKISFLFQRKLLGRTLGYFLTCAHPFVGKKPTKTLELLNYRDLEAVLFSGLTRDKVPTIEHKLEVINVNFPLLTIDAALVIIDLTKIENKFNSPKISLSHERIYSRKVIIEDDHITLHDVILEFCPDHKQSTSGIWGGIFQAQNMDSMPLERGDSGSPFVDKNGALVGIYTGKHRAVNEQYAQLDILPVSDVLKKFHIKVDRDNEITPLEGEPESNSLGNQCNLEIGSDFQISIYSSYVLDLLKNQIKRYIRTLKKWDEDHINEGLNSSDLKGGKIDVRHFISLTRKMKIKFPTQLNSAQKMFNFILKEELKATDAAQSYFVDLSKMLDELRSKSARIRKADQVQDAEELCDTLLRQEEYLENIQDWIGEREAYLESCFLNLSKLARNYGSLDKVTLEDISLAIPHNDKGSRFHVFKSLSAIDL